MQGTDVVGDALGWFCRLGSLPLPEPPQDVPRFTTPYDPHHDTMPTTLKEFESAFPQLVDDLISHAKAYGVPENGLSWWRQVRIPIN
jgi:hypothetical protein